MRINREQKQNSQEKHRGPYIVGIGTGGWMQYERHENGKKNNESVVGNPFALISIYFVIVVDCAATIAFVDSYSSKELSKLIGEPWRRVLNDQRHDSGRRFVLELGCRLLVPGRS